MVISACSNNNISMFLLNDREEKSIKRCNKKLRVNLFLLEETSYFGMKNVSVNACSRKMRKDP